jgi:hypothetical protein
MLVLLQFIPKKVFFSFTFLGDIKESPVLTNYLVHFNETFLFF